MNCAIEDYAVIGDTRTLALISREGSIDWLCWPRHDSPAVFLRLIDDEKGGFADVETAGVRSVRRRYVPETNVLETRIETDRGLALLLDFMPIAVRNPVPPTGPDGDAQARIVRILRCERGAVSGDLRVRPTFDFARVRGASARHSDAIVFEAGAERLTVSARGAAMREQDGIAHAEFTLTAGQSVALSIGYGRSDCDLAAAEDLLAATLDYWRAWSRRCTYQSPYRDAVLRSALCLKLLTYAPTGAIVAAGSLGLPEAAPGDRNFDYRFCWIRDASFTVTSFVNLGYLREATEYLRFLGRAIGRDGDEPALVHGVDGPVPDEEALPHLKGWRGVGPVSTGNAARNQDQYDIYGEYLIALHVWLEAIDYDASALAGQDLPSLVARLANTALRKIGEPDNGIWELRTGKRHHLHTKGMIQLALDRAARIGAKLEGLRPEDVEVWRRQALRLRADLRRRGWNDAVQAYTQSYGSDVLDAAVMRIALFHVVDPADVRMAKTLAAIDRNLSVGDLVYRYRADDGFLGEEASFTACAFWRVGCLNLSGRVDEARQAFERLLRRGNDVGLFAEEIEPVSGEHRGNFPQAFTHMAIINHAIRLRDARPAPAGAGSAESAARMS